MLHKGKANDYVIIVHLYYYSVWICNKGPQTIGIMSIKVNWLRQMLDWELSIVLWVLAVFYHEYD